MSQSDADELLLTHPVRLWVQVRQWVQVLPFSKIRGLNLELFRGSVTQLGPRNENA